MAQTAPKARASDTKVIQLFKVKSTASVREEHGSNMRSAEQGNPTVLLQSVSTYIYMYIRVRTEHHRLRDNGL